MENSLLTRAVLALSLLYLASCLKVLLNRKLRAIPTVGGSEWPMFSYLGAVRNVLRAAHITQEGYMKYKGGIFKYAELGAWRVIVTGAQQIDEIAKAPDDVLSFAEAANDSAQIVYTLGPEVHHDAWHISLIRGQLTRNLARVFSDMHDELAVSCSDEIPVKGDGWTKVRVKDAVTQIVCRASNRVFVGLPLCRNSDWCDLNTTFTHDVIKGAMIIKLFPEVLRPIVARFCTNVPARIERGVTHLEPIITERFRMQEKLGSEWADKPNDMLQWLIDAARGDERAVRPLALRVLVVNFAALHTTSVTFTQILYHLATYPQYIQPLREEAEKIVQQDGWTKAAVDKMHKVDSFVKEVQRVTGLGAWAVNRKVQKDFVLSDGTLLPAGTNVAAAARPIQYDDSNYADANTFNPWRFSDMRGEEGMGAKCQMISTSPYYLPFGHGKNACPGRFFAANEVKAMLAHVVTTYDVKMEDDGVMPPNMWIFASLIPNANAEVMFRKRQT